MGRRITKTQRLFCLLPQLRKAASPPYGSSQRKPKKIFWANSGGPEGGRRCFTQPAGLAAGLLLLLLLASCVPCRDGFVEVLGECIPLGALCQEGSVFDPEAGRCVALCAEGSVPTEKGCQPAFEALVANIEEAPEPNGDPALFPSFSLDEGGDAAIIGGFLDDEGDLDGFFLQTSGRVHLSVEAFSSGLAASFSLLGQGALSGFSRHAPAPRQSSVKRELILPLPGEYLLLVGSEAALEQVSSPPLGRAEYRVVLRPLPFPEPLTFPEDAPLDLSAEEVLFFAAPAEAGAILEVVARNLSGEEAPVVSFFTPDGLFLGAAKERLFRRVGGETFFSLETERGEGGQLQILGRAAVPSDLGVLAPGEDVSTTAISAADPALGVFFLLKTSATGVLRLQSENPPLLFSLADGLPLPLTTVAEGEETVVMSRVSSGVPLGVRVPGGGSFSLDAALPTQPFDEIEPNDPVPQPVTPGAFFADLAPGELDRFQITVQGPATLQVETQTGLLGASPDTLLTILGDSGLLAANDDIDELLCALGGSCFSRAEIQVSAPGPVDLEIVVEASGSAPPGRAQGDYQILFSVAP